MRSLATIVPDALADALCLEVPCGPRDAGLLADLARTHLRTTAGTAEDSDADLVLRLRDPRVFGAFAEASLQEDRLGIGVRRALAEHTFDLLPLPTTEGEVILVDARAPPRLLALAAFLAHTGDMTVLHVMHLVYAVFLDRSLVSGMSQDTRSEVLREILRLSESSERLRVLYGALHLSSIPEPEARAEFRWVLRTKSLPSGLLAALARLAAADDGGRAELARLAQTEGLLPSDVGEPEEPAVQANVPRLPDILRATGRRYLGRKARRATEPV